MEKFRIMVVDDYGPWCRCVCLMLERQPTFQVLCEVSDGLEAVQRAQELQPDLILLDIGLPTLSGIEAARRIRELSPGSKVLFASANLVPEVAREALSTGAIGYLVKAEAAHELLPAVEAALQGKQFVSASLSAEVFLEASRTETAA